MNSSRDFDFFKVSDVSLCLDCSMKARFKTLLLRLGRSQNWLADEVGLSHGTMSKIVNGDWFPKAETRLLIGKVLEVDSVILWGDSQYWTEYNKKMKYEEAKK